MAVRVLLWASRIAIVLGLGASACADHDIGQECPELLGDRSPVQGSGNRAETLEVVGQDVTFPCDQLICIATQGRPGYCSKKCRDDANCPSGFVCRVVQQTGEFAEQGFCAWAPCSAPSDCGEPEEFCCNVVEGADPAEELKLCDYPKDGKCP